MEIFRVLLAVSCYWVAAAHATTGLPLTDTRKIEFTTDEGTWMSLDVHPDGQYLVFDLLGDLYRLPLAGGEAAPITRGMAFDSQPRISPDGQWVAFVSDRDGANDLWIMRPDGGGLKRLSDLSNDPNLDNPERLSPQTPAWSPDSRYIVVTRPHREQGRWMLEKYPVDGSAPTLLLEKEKSIGAQDAAFSKDGRWLYFSTGGQVSRLDTATEKVFKFSNRFYGGAMRPLVSPDGKTLAYIAQLPEEREFSVRLRDLTTNVDRSLTRITEQYEWLGTGMHGQHPGYAFTPDGKALFVTSHGKIQRIEVQTGKVAAVPFTAQVSLDVGRKLEFPHRLDQGPVQLTIAQNPSVSPDGRRVVFSALMQLYVLDLNGGQPRKLAPQDIGQYKPAWSPDGKWIAYVSWSMQGGHVWKARADGTGKPRRLTNNPAFYSDVVFSPDGARILAMRGSAQTRLENYYIEYIADTGGEGAHPGTLWIQDLVWLPADGGDPQLVMPATGLTRPHFSADAGRVYLNGVGGSLTERVTTLVSVKLDGSDLKTHLSVKDPGRNSWAEEQQLQISPDGRWLLIRSRDQIYVSATPAADSTDGKPPQIDLTGTTIASQRLTDIGADYSGWAEGGKTIMWSVGSTIRRRSFTGVEPGASQAQMPVRAEARDQHPSVKVTQVNLEFPRATPRGNLLLRNATLITIAGARDQAGEQTIADADILIRDNRIAAIGPTGQLSVPAQTQIVDVQGKFIVPGFIDTHSHWSHFLKKYGVLQLPEWSAMITLASGVTTSVEVQLEEVSGLVYRDLTDAGQMLGPRLVMTGRGVVNADKGFSSYEETLHELQRYKNHYRTDYVKAYEVGTRRQHQMFVMAARELKLMATAHPKITRPMDGFSGHEHPLAVSPIYNDIAQLFAHTQTGYSPTIATAGSVASYFFMDMDFHNDPKLNHFMPRTYLDWKIQKPSYQRNYESSYRFDAMACVAASIRRAGGLVTVGSHSDTPGLNFILEMWALGTAMTPQEVLEAATLGGARMIGLAEDLGSLEPGKLADLVVLDKNPLLNLRDIRAVRYVMKNGVLYDGATLDEVWPERRPAPAFGWQRPRP